MGFLFPPVGLGRAATYPFGGLLWPFFCFWSHKISVLLVPWSRGLSEQSVGLDPVHFNYHKAFSVSSKRDVCLLSKVSSTNQHFCLLRLSLIGPSYAPIWFTDGMAPVAP